MKIQLKLLDVLKLACILGIVIVGYQDVNGMGFWLILIGLTVGILFFALTHYFEEKKRDLERMKPQVLHIPTIQTNRSSFKALRLKELRTMDPFAFEHYIAKLLKILGHSDAYVTPQNSDGGKDVIFTDSKTGKLCYCECKRYGAKKVITRPILQKLVGSALADDAIPYAIFTTGRFTEEALVEAKKTGVRCIGPKELLELIACAEKIEQEQLLKEKEIQARERRAIDIEGVSID